GELTRKWDFSKSKKQQAALQCSLYGRDLEMASPPSISEWSFSK
ncbi:uncharacterized, partial [Tachysurus ichikawai]